MTNYKIKINELTSNEGLTYWTSNLNLNTFKEAKKELINQVESYGTPHELIITKITKKPGCHFLEANEEKIITKIKARGLSFYDLLMDLL